MLNSVLGFQVYLYTKYIKNKHETGPILINEYKMKNKIKYLK